MYVFWWCFEFALNAITSFSTMPLRMFTIFGSCVLLGSAILSLYYAATRILNIDDPPRGIPTIQVMLLWNLGILSLGIGILGEYIGNIYSETKRRPVFIIDRVENIDEDMLQEAVQRDP